VFQATQPKVKRNEHQQQMPDHHQLVAGKVDLQLLLVSVFETALFELAPVEASFRQLLF